VVESGRPSIARMKTCRHRRWSRTIDLILVDNLQNWMMQSRWWSSPDCRNRSERGPPKSSLVYQRGARSHNNWRITKEMVWSLVVIPRQIGGT